MKPNYRLLVQNLLKQEQKLDNLLLYVDFYPAAADGFHPILLKDGAMICLWELSGVDYEGLSEVDKEMFAYFLRCALEQLPDDGRGYMISNTLLRVPARAPQLDPGGADAPGVVRFVQERKQEFWEQIAGASYENRLYYCLRYYDKPAEPAWRDLISDTRTFRFIRADLEARAEKLHRGYQAIKAGLARFGVRELDREDVFRLIYRLVNRAEPPRRYRSDLSLGVQVAASQVRIRWPRHVEVNGRLTAVIGLKYPPEVSRAMYLRRFYELPFPLILKQSMALVDKAKIKKSQEFRKNIATALSAADKKCALYVEECSEFQDRVERLKELPLWWTFVIQVEAAGEDELKDRVQQVLTLLKEIGAAGQEDQANLKLGYFAMFPGHERLYGANRKNLITSANAGDFMSAFNYSRGDRQPVEYFQDRLNGIFAYDPFTAREPGHHMTITGPLGSGKSFLANKLLISMLARNPRLYVVDLSNSFTPLFEFLSGELPGETSIVTVTRETTDMAFNPFLVADPERPPTEEEIHFGLGLIRIMAGQGIAPGVEWELRKGVEKFYRSYRTLLRNRPPGPDAAIPPITLLAETLETEVRSRELANVIRLWTEGRKGRVFNTGRDTLHAARLSLFDLADLDQDETLLQSLVYVIFEKIYAECSAGDRSVQKMLVMDEAHRYLKHPAFQHWVELFYRIGRHLNLAVVLLTQSIRDLVSDAIWSKGVIGNTRQAFFFSGQKSIQKELAAFGLSEYQIEQYQRLDPGRREVLYWSSSGLTRILRPVTDPYTYWLATTHPVERVARARVRRHAGGDINRAIEICVRETRGQATVEERTDKLDRYLRRSEACQEEVS